MRTIILYILLYIIYQRMNRVGFCKIFIKDYNDELRQRQTCDCCCCCFDLFWVHLAVQGREKVDERLWQQRERDRLWQD